ncbi:MAG: hypothetical protein WC069_04550 [Candidatus Shapirobacteria bacterium]
MLFYLEEKEKQKQSKLDYIQAAASPAAIFAMPFARAADLAPDAGEGNAVAIVTLVITAISIYFMSRHDKKHPKPIETNYLGNPPESSSSKSSSSTTPNSSIPDFLTQTDSNLSGLTAEAEKINRALQWRMSAKDRSNLENKLKGVQDAINNAQVGANRQLRKEETIIHIDRK